MFRIRFHGRGGQGMKTASRIVGTAAFRQGYYAQDSPIYGAERRGAPMIAFTRFDSRPVFERGLVTVPDLVVIADESLLGDPLVRPLQGLSPSGSVLLNSTNGPEIPAAIARDFTGLALTHTKSISALSVALGAAAAKLANLELRFLEEAVSEELAQLKLGGAHLEKNLDLARACFASVSISTSVAREADRVQSSTVRVITPAYDGPWAGTASVAAPPNTPLRKTGDWRLMRPVIDLERCTHCWICFVNCPDGAITLDNADTPHIDYDLCKGCLICAEECPIDAVQSVREGVQ
jgi:pyruvate ferredoxin oxidoreductase gamma subunit